MCLWLENTDTTSASLANAILRLRQKPLKSVKFPEKIDYPLRRIVKK